VKLLFENWRKFLKENNTNFISDLIDNLSDKLHNVDDREIEDWMGNFITTLKMYQTISKRRSPEQADEWLKGALTYKGRDHYDWLEEHAPEYSEDWKQLIENWREYLNKEETFPYQIYCDMDSVLVDLVPAVLKKAKQDADDEKLRRGVTKIIAMEWKWTKKNPKYQKALDYIDDIVSNDVEFWATLPPTPDKDTLWDYISQYDPIILSHPWDKDSEEGKRIWIEEKLIPQPKKVILTGDKHNYAVNEDGTKNVLIDDFEKYTIPWEDAGGIAILHTSIESTIEKLKELKENSNETTI